MCSGTCADSEQRVADIVAVANVCDFQAAQSRESLFEREKIRERLAWVKAVGERVDHGNSAVLGELFERFLGKRAPHDALHPALRILGECANGCALAKAHGRVVEENGGAAQACDADFECDTRSQRRLLENEREEASGQRGAIAVGARFNVCREVDEVANLRRPPLHAGEEVVSQRECCGNGVHIHLVAASAIDWTGSWGCSDFLGVAGTGWAAGFFVRASTISNFSRNSATSRRRMMKGGRSLRMWSCVQFMTRPRRSACSTYGAPSTVRSTPMIKPSPRISRMKSKRAASFSRPARSSAPRSRMLVRSFCSSTTVRNSSAVAQTSGPPPNVVPCMPGVNVEANFSFAMIAPSGRPPARGFATVTMSGGAENCW